MRIVFICGGLEPGRNGVGDYCRRLAGELRERGHQCLLVGVQDVESGAEPAEPGPPAERRTAALTDRAEGRALAERIRTWRPDWISVQFVPYAFDARGIVKPLGAYVAALAKETEAPVHVLFHELWLGESSALPLHQKLLGRLQRRALFAALRKWKPARLHATNPLYLNRLNHEGLRATRLPLFGNIPIAPPDPRQAEALIGPPPKADDERVFVFPFSQSAGWPAATVVERIEAIARRAGVRPRFVQLGHNRAFDLHWPKISEVADSLGRPCFLLGPRDGTEISQVLRCADIGVSPAHPHFAVKSGAVVSMLEHGLPVLCTGADPGGRQAPRDPGDSGLRAIDEPEDALAALFREPPRGSPASRLPAVARQFVQDLERAAHDG